MASNTFGFEGERAELASLLSSGYFDRSPNLYRFLVFVCEKYFRGEADEVKEYSVAVEALGRPQNFDQKKDSIVRVEAHRLRKRLDEYYAGEGASHPCRIVLPSGSYVPQFLVHEGSGQDLVRLAEAPDPPARAASPTHAAGRSVPASPVRPAQWTRGTWQRFLAAAAALLLMLISILTWNALNRSESNALADEPAITTAPAVPPVASLDAKGENGIRLLAGSPLSSFVDRFGHTWTGDAFFNGGSAVETRMPNLRFTAVPELYGHRREGNLATTFPWHPGTTNCACTSRSRYSGSISWPAAGRPAGSSTSRSMESRSW
ncbi:MAG: hypothetical protein U5J83_08410 [Bryobacterales bacterium]|nr:hypothetical protein [Bryobacterales bacterium]